MTWEPTDLEDHTIDMAIHAALIPGGDHGRILYFGGYFVDDTHLFDVKSHAIETAPSLPGYNIFCSGHSWLADGRLLVGGGQLELGGAPPPHAPPPPDIPIPHLHGNMSWGGERRCTIFHPLGLAWVETGPLNLDPRNDALSGGRWYPTLSIFERYLSEVGDRVRALGGNPDAIGPSPTGGREPNRPEEEDERPREVGKISELIYDCFGDFEGFSLETCSDRHVFRSCEKAMEEVALRACKERMKVTVVADPNDRHRPLRFILHCC
jgi:hypothetical protein